MEDWQGLLNWSTKYHDGTKDSNVEPMSQEDKEWLEAAMKQYTFSDTDKLNELCKLMREDIAAGFKQPDMVDKMDEVQELIELHERNNLNLAVMGGLESVMKYIEKHPDPAVRKMASNTFS